MKTRVTITLDPEVHRRAKQAARKKPATVSGLLETLPQTESAPRKRSLVAEMTGIASLREPAPGTSPRYDALKAKYVC